jgi:hypothetical protein
MSVSPEKGVQALVAREVRGAVHPSYIVVCDNQAAIGSAERPEILHGVVSWFPVVVLLLLRGEPNRERQFSE